MAILPTQWTPNTDDPRNPSFPNIKTEKKEVKKLNFGVFFDGNNLEEQPEVLKVLHKLKHLDKKKIQPGAFLFNASDLLHVMELGKPQKRKRTKSQQYSWIDFSS